MVSPEMMSVEREKAPIEIERKFLIGALPDNLDDYQREHIRQGYLAIEASGTEVRLRSRAGLFYLTVKTKGDLTRIESEVTITADQFNELWPRTEKRRIEKTRYMIPYEDSTIELDIYEGILGGLVTAEVEFEDEAKARNFMMPDWLDSMDITSDKRFKNQQLATDGIPL